MDVLGITPHPFRMTARVPDDMVCMDTDGEWAAWAGFDCTTDGERKSVVLVAIAVTPFAPAPGAAPAEVLKAMVRARYPAGTAASWDVMAKYFRRDPPDEADARSYNLIQRTAYLSVIFVLFPLVIWTGLAMSPAFVSAVPSAVTLLGGRQSARTLHFFVSGLLLLFLVVHVGMVILAGFRSRMRAMITGAYPRSAHE